MEYTEILKQERDILIGENRLLEQRVQELEQYSSELENRITTIFEKFNPKDIDTMIIIDDFCNECHNMSSWKFKQMIEVYKDSM